jgi:diguanylate cyclase (GGDEF)-like protein
MDAPTDPTMWHPHDALFAPLTSPDGTLLGALSVDLPVSGRLPDEQQKEMLALFADHAAIAIEHARSHASLQHSRDQLRHAATHDPLTGLQNRSVLTEQAPALAQRADGEIAVLVIDLDGFKHVNDTAGHQAGDELLCVLAQRMRSCIRPGDLLARTGGDEFVVVLAAPRLDHRVRHLVHDLADALQQPTRDHAGTDLRVSASIGVSVSSTPADFDEILCAADRDMYRNKKNREIDVDRPTPLTRSA